MLGHDHVVFEYIEVVSGYKWSQGQVSLIWNTEASLHYNTYSTQLHTILILNVDFKLKRCSYGHSRVCLVDLNAEALIALNNIVIKYDALKIKASLTTFNRSEWYSNIYRFTNKIIRGCKGEQSQSIAITIENTHYQSLRRRHMNS